MENPEEVLHSLDEFSKLKPNDIPRELEEYLLFVAKTGDPVFQWSDVKCLFREKLASVIVEFYETSPTLDLPQCPNVDPFNYESMKSSLLERLESFTSAPFTIQRLCELLTTPRKEYSRVDKFMRAIEKNILVVSTIEPGNSRRSDNNGQAELLVNGVLDGRGIELGEAIEATVSSDGVNVMHIEDNEASNNDTVKVNESRTEIEDTRMQGDSLSNNSWDQTQSESVVKSNKDQVKIDDELGQVGSLEAGDHPKLNPVTGDMNNVDVSSNDKTDNSPQLMEHVLPKKSSHLNLSAIRNKFIVQATSEETIIENITSTEPGSTSSDNIPLADDQTVTVAESGVSNLAPKHITSSTPATEEELYKECATDDESSNPKSPCEIVSETREERRVSPVTAEQSSEISPILENEDLGENAVIENCREVIENSEVISEADTSNKLVHSDVPQDNVSDQTLQETEHLISEEPVQISITLPVEDCGQNVENIKETDSLTVQLAQEERKQIAVLGETPSTEGNVHESDITNQELSSLPLVETHTITECSDNSNSDPESLTEGNTMQLFEQEAMEVDVCSKVPSASVDEPMDRDNGQHDGENKNS